MPVSGRLLVAASVVLLAGAWNGYAWAKIVRVQLTSQIEVFVQRDGTAIEARSTSSWTPPSVSRSTTAEHKP